MKTGAHFVRGISVAESEILIINLQMTTWNRNKKISGNFHKCSEILGNFPKYPKYLGKIGKNWEKLGTFW
jgi:hypothetical protein